MSDILDISKLTFEGDFNAQVDEILKFIKMTEDDMEKLQILFKDVNIILGDIWKGCQLEVFGSITTGLSMKNSDIDILVNLPKNIPFNPTYYICKAEEALLQNENFNNITTKKRTKIPKMSFQYKPSDIYCDISFSGRSAIKNSQLLLYLTSINKFVSPLIFIIRYWAKIKKITGKGFMSNYCLTLLIIFYLQQKKIVPTIMTLQENVDEEIIDKFNTAFVQVVGLCTDNKDDLYTLLGDFFKFYEYFYFEDNVISLYTGSVTKRSETTSGLVLNSFMCVQDPFIHDRNVAVVVSPGLGKEIINFFQKAVSIYMSTSENDFLQHLLKDPAKYTQETSHYSKKPDFRRIKRKGFRNSYNKF